MPFWHIGRVQDRYAGDLGDYLKFGLLRWLAPPGVPTSPRLGVVWPLAAPHPAPYPAPRQSAFALSAPPGPERGSPQHSQLSQACATRRIVDHYYPPAGGNDPRS